MPIIHTVYLPPAIDPTTSPAHNIRFRRVQPPHETESQLPPCPRRGLGDSLLGDLLLGVPPVPAASKRKAEADDAYLNENTEVTAPWSGEQEQVKPPANLWPRTPRRRSRRLYPDESGGFSLMVLDAPVDRASTTADCQTTVIPPVVSQYCLLCKKTRSSPSTRLSLTPPSCSRHLQKRTIRRSLTFPAGLSRSRGSYPWTYCSVISDSESRLQSYRPETAGYTS